MRNTIYFIYTLIHSNEAKRKANKEKKSLINLRKYELRLFEQEEPRLVAEQKRTKPIKGLFRIGFSL